MAMIVESRIDEVKVYHSGATVYRLAELAGPIPAEVELQGLPLALYDPTVRVRVVGVEPAGAELAATDIRVGLHATTASESREDPDRVALKAVQAKIRSAAAALRQIELEGSYLRSMRVPDRPAAEEGKPPPASPMAARVLLESLVDAGLQQRSGETRALRRTLRALQEEAATLEDRIARASSARQLKPHELRKLVVVRLNAGATAVTAARLVVEYFVPGARWAPAYQCRLSRDCGAAELQLRALVCQRSGEDWRGVRLTLSTASPLTWTELPELTSIRIGRAQREPPAVRGFRPPPRGAAALFADYDRGRARAGQLVPPAPSWSPPALQAFEPELHDVPAPEEAFDDAGTPAGSAEYAKAAAEPLCDEFREAEVAAPPMMRAAPAPVAAFAAGMAMPAAPPPPPPPRRPAAPAASVARSAPQAARRLRGRPQEAPTGAELALGPPPAAAALAFPLLRLADPGKPQERSRLLPVDLRACYLELLTRTRVEVEIDVLQVVEQAQREASALAAAPLPEGACDVRSVAGHFDFVYLADARVDLESDGAFHSLALGNREAAADVRYIVAPREDTSVFRMAKLRNPLAAPLLPGPVEVHVGGDYVLTTTLPAVPRAGEFQLGLGVEQAIKVARNTRFEERRSGTKVVAMTELHHAIEIELVNNLDREILCDVRERIPQAAEEAEVVVEETDVRPAWAPYTQRERNAELRGGRAWEIRVGPGKTEKLHAAYVVKIYANNELVGGNRREA